jgi:ComF family protein
MKPISALFTDLLELFYPDLCITCGDRLVSQEKYVCFNCWSDLPLSRFHRDPENPVARLLWGRVNIESAASYFHYRKGSKYQKLIHFIKYKGLKELGQEAGMRFGRDLKEAPLFSGIDCIVPVPLHPRKQKKRGYNQSEWIARGVSAAMGKSLVNGNLIRNRDSSTQTRKSRFERWQNVEDIFEVLRPHEFSGSHILLVDDVVTTGSTLEACAFQLLKAENTKVSAATLAFSTM